MANSVDFVANFKWWVNLKRPCDLFTLLMNMPTQEWKKKNPYDAESWAKQAYSVDEKFIQNVVSTVKHNQFTPTPCRFSLESLPLPPKDCCPSPYIQHLCIIAHILHHSWGIEVQKIDDKTPPQTLTVSCHRDAHWLNPTAPYLIKAGKEEFRTDCTLKFGEKLFKVHSVVLSTKSSVFEKMFQSQCKEAEHGAVIPIVMDNFDKKSAELLLDYFYTGELKLEGASVQVIDNLVNFSTQYDMLHLQQLCFEHLCKNINADNLKEYIDLVRHYQHEELEAALIEHIGMEITADNFNQFMEMEKADKLGVAPKYLEVIAKQIQNIDSEPFFPRHCTKLNEIRKFLDLAFKWHESSMVFTVIDQVRKVLLHSEKHLYWLEKRSDYLAFVCEYQSRLEAEGSWLQTDKNDIQTMKNTLLEYNIALIKISETQDNDPYQSSLRIDLKGIEKCLTIATTYKLEQILNSCAAVLEKEFEIRPANHVPLDQENLQKILALADQFNLEPVKNAYSRYVKISNGFAPENFLF